MGHLLVWSFSRYWCCQYANNVYSYLDQFNSFIPMYIHSCSLHFWNFDDYYVIYPDIFDTLHCKLVGYSHDLWLNCYLLPWIVWCPWFQMFGITEIFLFQRKSNCASLLGGIPVAIVFLNIFVEARCVVVGPNNNGLCRLCYTTQSPFSKWKLQPDEKALILARTSFCLD
jgi:hypothetical protein